MERQRGCGEKKFKGYEYLLWGPITSTVGLKERLNMYEDRLLYSGSTDEAKGTKECCFFYAVFFPQKWRKKQSLDFFSDILQVFLQVAKPLKTVLCHLSPSAVMSGAVSTYWKCETGPPTWSSNSLRRHYAPHQSLRGLDCREQR